MSKKNDDNIERFFRKAVRQHDNSLLENDWRNMEKMLDALASLQGAQRQRKIMRAIAIVAIGLILLGNVYLVAFYKQTPDVISYNQTFQETQEANDKVVQQEEGKDSNSTASQLFSEEDTSNEDGTLNKVKSNNKEDKGQKTVPANKALAETNQQRSIDQADLSKKNRNNTNNKDSEHTSKDRSVITRVVPPAFQEGPILNEVQEQGGHPTVLRSETKKEVKSQKEGLESDKDQSSVIDQQKSSIAQNPLQDEQSVKQADRKNESQALSEKQIVNKEEGDKKEVGEETGGQEMNAGPVTQQEQLSSGKEQQSIEATSGKDPGQDVLAGGSSQQTLEPEKDTLDKQEVLRKAVIQRIEEYTRAEEEKKKGRGSRWSVMLSLAPDYSTTRLDEMTGPGSAYGLRIGYQLFSNISIQTGLLKTAKRYEGYGEDYNLPKSYLEYLDRIHSEVPDEITGKCTVVEIPLWVQVNVITREKSRIFASGGISSYIMLDESYRYKYKGDNNKLNSAPKGWSSSENSTYSFGVGHLSLGYERYITPSIGLGIEPFLKVPFSGIGWAKVNLYTTGVYANIRYRFLKRV